MEGAPSEERNERPPGQEDSAGSVPQHKRQRTGTVGRQRWSLHLGTAEGGGGGGGRRTVVALAVGVNISQVSGLEPGESVQAAHERAGQHLSLTLSVPLVVRKTRMSGQSTLKQGHPTP